LVAAKAKATEVRISERLSENVAGAFVNAFILANYAFAIRSTNESGLTPDHPHYHRKIHNVKFIYRDSSDLRANETLNYYITIAEATLLSRTTGNTRASIATPEYM